MRLDCERNRTSGDGALLCSAAVKAFSTRFLGRSRHLLSAIALCTAASGACAHDTWLHVSAVQPGVGLLGLDMGSGARYPKSEEAVPGSRLVEPECVDETGTTHPLVPRQDVDVRLELRARMGSAGAASCWTELLPVELVLTPELVQVYFQDVRPPQAVKDAWAARQKAGIGWKEIYRKFTRIETAVPGPASPASWAALRKPRNYPLELLPVGDAPVRPGIESEYQALANGKPVAGLAVEFVSLRSPVGIWRETDAQGRMKLALPYAGEWLLRATVLDVPPSLQDVWRSKFATLTVQVR